MSAAHGRAARPRFGVPTRAWVFLAVLAAYVAVTVMVMVSKSPVLSLDQWLLDRHLWGRHPEYHPWIQAYVIVGQRGPATLFFLPFFFWVAWRQRTTRPLVLLVSALILLNVSIGVVKYLIGRIGPHFQDNVHLIFAGGNIYPSGHVSNVVVLYALITWIAPKYRRTLIAVTVWLSITVGLCTVYLRTHWFSDVLGGWLAGALVLLALPTVMPFAQRVTDRSLAWLGPRVLRRERSRRVAHRIHEWADRHIPRPAPEAAAPVRAAQPATPVRPIIATNGPSPAGTRSSPIPGPLRSRSFPARVVAVDNVEDEPARRGDPRISPSNSST